MRIDLKLAWQWIWDHPLPLSLGANVALVLLLAALLDGSSIAYTNNAWELKLAQPLPDRVAALFKDDGTRMQVRNLLNAHGYYEISQSHKDTEAITRALGQLDAAHSLVSQLRELSQRHKAPFEPRDRKVTLVLSASPLVGRGEAMICEQDADELQSKFIEFFTRDERDGFYVEATRMRRCPETRNIVEVSATDWRTLQLSGTAIDTDARIYLHRPYERRADESQAVAHTDAQMPHL